MVNSAGSVVGDIWTYFGVVPIKDGGCVPNTWTGNPDSGLNYATDSAGPRWDGSPVGCPSYVTFSIVKACADTMGLTIANVFLVTDGGFDVAASGSSGTQTVYFQSIQVNGVTRFP